MPKCAFTCCGNQSSGPRRKPRLAFYSFNDVPAPVSKHWIKLVSRERRDPNYQPSPESRICAAHFEPYEITASKKLYSTAIPTLNIGPYDDTIVIDEGKDKGGIGKNKTLHVSPYDKHTIIINEDINNKKKDENIKTLLTGHYDDKIIIDENNINKEKEDFVCIIENHIQQSVDQNDDNVVCVIENQLSSEPTPQSIDVLDKDVDIEEQIQWSLVGTSKHLDGLLNARDPEVPGVLLQPSQPFIASQCSVGLLHTWSSEHPEASPQSKPPYTTNDGHYAKENIIILQSEDSETETENDYKERYSNNYKRVKEKKTKRKNSDEKNNDSKFNGQYAQFIKTYDKEQLLYGKRRNSQVLRSKQKNNGIENKTVQNYKQSLRTQPEQVETQRIRVSLAPNHFTAVNPQSIPAIPNQLPTIMQQSMPTVQSKFLSKTQSVPIPTQISSPLLTAALTKTPQFPPSNQITSPIIGESSQTSTPIMVYDPTAPINGTHLYSLVPLNSYINSLQLSGLAVEESSTTYSINNISPYSSNSVTGTDAPSTQTVIDQVVNESFAEPGFVIKTENRDSEDAYETIIVKTEGGIDF